jgi:cyclopropane fatty-acyl-phospholipid synthase-like methyltransferase
MASSDTAQISTIVDLIQILNPKSILDIGCGWGKYGFLSREYLMGDYWNMDTTLINAVEGFEKNINELQKNIYNNIFFANALNWNDYLKQDYELILIIDAFEHFEENKGRELIKILREKCKYLLISIPRYVSVQKGYSDDPNKFEEHRAFWTRKMFKKLGNCDIIPNNARKTIALYTQTPQKKEAVSKFKTKKLFWKFFPYLLADIVNHIKWFFNKNNPELFVKKN